jgi:signal transduction histidine kinase/DNA-binding response OmpR family regulator
MATILIVDDQPDNLYVLQRLLKGHGYDVLQAEDGKTALALAAERAPDLMLLDVMMPELDGFEVVQRMRDSERTRAIPVVLLTANAPDERLKIQGLKLGADEYLTQPINNNELLARVQALLRTKRTQDELMARNQQLAALLDIVQASTSTLELAEVGRRLVDGALAATRMDLGGIWLRQDDELVCLAQHGYSPDLAEARQRIALADSRVGAQVMEQKQPRYGSAAHLFGADNALAQEAQTFIVLPLLHRATALGVLQLGTREQREVGAEELAFLGAIANAAAVAVQNARLFEESDRHRQELEQMDVEKDEFISIVSHELKNPLASIKGYAGLLQRRAKKDSTLQQAVKGLEVIEQQVNRMSTLLDHLRDVSQIGMDRFTIEPGPLDIAELTQRIAYDMQTTTNNHDLQLSVAEDPLMVDGDEFRLSQALTNLIGNAIKYSPAGGTIEIAARRSDDPPSRPAEIPASSFAMITVSDQGIGIPQDVQDRLFQRFFRAPNTKGRISGMGLGLYITREIIQRHGGYLWVESEEGNGSTFGIALPLATAASPDGQPTPEQTAHATPIEENVGT